MQGIEFEDEGNTSGLSMKASQVAAGKPSFMMRLLEKAGITDRSTANLILLGVAMLFLSITFFLYAEILGKNKPSKQTAEQISAQIKMMQQMQNIK